MPGFRDHGASVDRALVQVAGAEARMQRLREQRAGGQVMSVDEIDRLAVSVAHLVAAQNGS